MSVVEGERDGADDAAQSFRDLSAEVTVMRKAVERLEPTLEAMKPEDYSQDLSRIMGIMRDFDKRLSVIEASPALRTSPQHFGALLAHSGSSVFQDVVRPLRSDVDAIRREREMLQVLVGNMADARRLQWQRWLFALLGTFAGAAAILILEATRPALG